MLPGGIGGVGVQEVEETGVQAEEQECSSVERE